MRTSRCRQSTRAWSAGEFAEKNDSLYIISTGVSGGSNGHTTAETMNFDMVEVSIDFLVALAERLANE